MTDPLAYYVMSVEYRREVIWASLPDWPLMLGSKGLLPDEGLWIGDVLLSRHQYSLWAGKIFLGEISYDAQHKLTAPWRAELSTQKYLGTVGRYSTEQAAWDALVSAALEAFDR